MIKHAILRKAGMNRFHRTHSQSNAARSHLEKCIDVHQLVETEKSRLSLIFFFTFVLGAMPILLLDCDNDVARKRTVSRKSIAKEHWCLETLRNKRGPSMTLVNTSLVLIWNIDEAMTRRQKSLRVWQRTSRKRWASKWKLLKHRNVSTSCTESRAVTQWTMIQSESKGENADISSSGDRNVIGSLHCWNDAAFGFKMTLHLLHWHLTESKPRNNGRSQVKVRKNLTVQICSLERLTGAGHHHY